MAELSNAARQRMLKLHQHVAKDARLYNFAVAVRARTGDGEPAMWIPITPSVDGGRPSVYDLPIDESTLMGTYVTADRCVHEYMSRTDDDHYTVRQVTASGDPVFEGEGDLTVIDSDIGYGSITWKNSAQEDQLAIRPMAVPVHVWVGYSLIKVDVG